MSIGKQLNVELPICSIINARALIILLWQWHDILMFLGSLLDNLLTFFILNNVEFCRTIGFGFEALNPDTHLKKNYFIFALSFAEKYDYCHY